MLCHPISVFPFCQIFGHLFSEIITASHPEALHSLGQNVFIVMHFQFRTRLYKDDELFQNCFLLIFGGFLSFIPNSFSAAASLIGLIFVVLMVLGIINAATGKAKELPFLGRFRVLK